MEKIHTDKSKKRIKIGEPFEHLIDELLKSTNSGNLSRDWNSTDMARYALAKLWTSTGKTLPRECEMIMPRFYADLDL